MCGASEHPVQCPPKPVVDERYSQETEVCYTRFVSLAWSIECVMRIERFMRDLAQNGPHTCGSPDDGWDLFTVVIPSQSPPPFFTEFLQ